MSWIRRALFLMCAVLLAGIVRWTPGVSGEDWLPIPPNELKMTSEPLAPGAPAIYLYRQVDRDDISARETNYLRIKILTEEGRKYADVQIPFYKDLGGSINDIRARTIEPDGRVVNFDGKVFDQTVVKAQGLKLQAKTFTMPDVQVGSIIEYRYVSGWDSFFVIDSHWIVSEELFTKHAKFSLLANPNFVLRTSWPRKLPPGTQPPKRVGSVILMEADSIPAFQVEDFMPPENELKSRVDFLYHEGDPENDPDKFWTQIAKRRYAAVEDFVGKRKAMEQAVGQIVSPGDSPETKLQKIYARCQQIRNLRYETQKTEQELSREKLKNVKNVEDIWKLGYGNGVGITWLFLGLARAAGLDAYPVLVSRRSDYFFSKESMDPNQLNDNVVLVKLGGKDLYFDPGTRFTPFGMLPWPETGVAGLQLGKDGGVWLKTTIPDSPASQIERKAVLLLDNSGDLKGTLSVTYSGLEALERRLEERQTDATGRKEFLENEVKGWVPAGIRVELKSQPDWESSSDTMQAEFALTVPGWATAAGRHAFVPLGLFSAPEKHLFEHAPRVHPIYLHFPWQETDEISVQLPMNLQVSSLPLVQSRDLKTVAYQSAVTSTGGMLYLKRELKMNLLLLDAKYYPGLQSFLQSVRTGDEQQVVLQTGSTAPGK